MNEEPDGLAELFSDPPNKQETSDAAVSFRRRLVGQPRIWPSAALSAVGIAWFVLAIIDPAVWRFVSGGFYLVLGLGQLAIAVSDRRHRRGRYRFVAAESSEPDVAP